MKGRGQFDPQPLYKKTTYKKSNLIRVNVTYKYIFRFSKWLSSLSKASINSLWFQNFARIILKKWTSGKFSSGHFCFVRGPIEINYAVTIRQVSL